MMKVRKRFQHRQLSHKNHIFGFAPILQVSCYQKHNEPLEEDDPFNLL